MELPRSGPFLFSQTPAPSQPALNETLAPLFSAFTPLSNVSLSEEPSRNKLRRVTKEDETLYERMPTPFESEERRIHKRYQAFIAQFPNLSDQLAALRTIDNGHELRKEIIEDLIGCGKIDEVFHFYLEMTPCQARTQFLNNYYKGIAAIDQREKLKAVLSNVSLFQPLYLETFLLHLAYALLLSDQISEVIEIYNRPQTKKVELLYFIFRSKIRNALDQDPMTTIHQINALFPEPMRSELYFVTGTALVKFQRADLIPLFIPFMQSRKDALIQLVNTYQK